MGVGGVDGVHGLPVLRHHLPRHEYGTLVVGALVVPSVRGERESSPIATESPAVPADPADSADHITASHDIAWEQLMEPFIAADRQQNMSRCDARAADVDVR
jgi:hypothetical protein